MFQPLRDEGGTTASDVPDGTGAIKVALRYGKGGSRVVFSIDVDDRLTSYDLGQMRVTGGEMAGSMATFETENGTMIRAVFDVKNRAQACS